MFYMPQVMEALSTFARESSQKFQYLGKSAQKQCAVANGNYTRISWYKKRRNDGYF